MTSNKGAIIRIRTGIFRVLTTGKSLKSFHFYAIIFVTVILVFIYQAWPWREWVFTEGIWVWFPWLSSLNGLALMEIMNRIIGIPFFIPIVYAAVTFGWRGAFIIGLISLAGVAHIIISIWSFETIMTNIVLLMLPLLVVSIVTFDLEWHRKERRITAERLAEQKIYTDKMLEAQENERGRIAQELHDDTIQKLLVIANRAQKMARSHGEDETIAKEAEWIRDSTLTTVEDMRRVSINLRPSVLDDLGLVSAMRWLVDRLEKESDIHTKILVHGKIRKLSSQTEVTIFRVLQEALNNIKRHSEAKEATINLKFNHTCLKININDNGRGFRPPKKFASLVHSGTLGLIGMKQRIDSLGGILKINSRPGEGTSLSLEVRY